MYKHILIPLENSSADETILTHIRPLARVAGATLLLVHVADGWVARNFNQLQLAESQERTGRTAPQAQQPQSESRDEADEKDTLPTWGSGREEPRGWITHSNGRPMPSTLATSLPPDGAIPAFIPAARPDGETALAVRRKIPPLSRRQVMRLPATLQEAHLRWQEDELKTPVIDQLRRRSRRLALSLLELGEDLEETERQLMRWKFHPALCRESAVWAWDRHQRALEAATASSGEE